MCQPLLKPGTLIKSSFDMHNHHPPVMQLHFFTPLNIKETRV